MKSFLSSFLCTGVLCAALWLHWRPDDESVPRAPANRAAQAGPLSPPAASMSPAAVQTLWRGASEASPANAKQWAALDAVNEAALAAWATTFNRTPTTTYGAR